MSTCLRLLRFLRGQRLRVALAVVLGCATIAANVGLLAVSGYLVSAAALRPLLIALWFPMYLVQFFGVSRAFFRYGERLVSHRMTLGLLADARSWFYGRLIPLAPARLLEYRSGDLLARIAGDIQELENIYVRAAAPLMVALIATLGIAAILASFSPSLAVIAVLSLALTGIGVPLLARALAARPAGAHPALRAALATQLVDGIQGMPDLLAFGRAAEQQTRIDALERALGGVQRRMALVDGLRGALGILTANLALVAVLALAIPLVATGRIHGAYLAFLALLLLGSFEAVQPLGQAFQYLGRSLKAGERLFEVADVAPLVTDPPTPLPRPSGIPTLIFDGVRFAYPATEHPHAEVHGCGRAEEPRISIRGVRPGTRLRVSPSAGCNPLVRDAMRDKSRGSVRHDALPRFAEAPALGITRASAWALKHGVSTGVRDPSVIPPGSDRRPLALEGVSLTLAPGRRLAIVGPSGSGKSTLARLALRAWDPTGGEIRLNGASLPCYALDDLRSMFAVVAQDTYIFSDTLRHNLLLGRPGASDADLAHVVEQAQLTDLVARLPRGLDSAIGEQGGQISGGERQRVAIARALLKDASILILDEATANLDPITERALLETIHDLMRGRSLLVISHRLVTMERMDEILVLDHGRVIERGTHATLLAGRGAYHQLFETQNQLLFVV